MPLTFLNPFDIPMPSGVNPRIWIRCTGFANESYTDLEGAWCQRIIPPRYGQDVANDTQAHWLTLQTDKERWVAAITYCLNQEIKPPSTLDRIMDHVFNWAFGAIVGTGIDAALGTSGAANIIREITDTTNEAGSVASGVSQAAITSLVDTGTTATRILSDLSTAVLGAISDNNSVSTGVLTDLLRSSTSGIDGLLRNGSDLLSDLSGRAIDAIEAVLAKALGNQSAIVGIIGDILSDHIEKATDGEVRVSRAVERALEAEVEQARRNSEAITRGIEGGISRSFGAADSVLSRAAEAITAAGTAETSATQKGAAQIAEVLGKGLGGLGGLFSRLDEEGSAENNKDSASRIDKAFRAVSAAGNCPDNFGEFVHDFIDQLTSEWDVRTPIIHMLGEVQLVMGIVQPALQVLGNCVAQAAARAAPTALHDAGDLQKLMNFGLIEKPEAMAELLSQGFTPEKADRVLALRREIPDVGFIQAWFLRGMIKPDEAFQYLQERGFTLDDAQAILESAYFIPPPQDLITMAVREVFSPDVAKKFGQYEDFPKAFADYARMQGISEQWAERYWAAHWSLPSPTQGFEMYQRDVITRAELEMLLKALDIMPFWREKLTQIAFRPVTRVDIRRMHDLGLLSHDEMVTRYRHMGYSPTDAEFMAKFTERLNAPKGEQNVEELEGATRATTIQLLERGAISEKQAEEILKEMGTGDRAVNVLLTNSRMKRELKEREAEEALILEQAKAGQISFTEAEDSLARIGLEPVELATARAKLKRAEAQQTKLPTKADLDKLLQADLLTDIEYVAHMTRIGYSLSWARNFLLLAKKKETQQ
jgi:hypothetical protein